MQPRAGGDEELALHHVCGHQVQSLVSDSHSTFGQSPDPSLRTTGEAPSPLPAHSMAPKGLIMSASPSASMLQGGHEGAEACPSLPPEILDMVACSIKLAADKARFCMAVRCLCRPACLKACYLLHLIERLEQEKLRLVSSLLCLLCHYCMYCPAMPALPCTRFACCRSPWSHAQIRPYLGAAAG